MVKAFQGVRFKLPLAGDINRSTYLTSPRFVVAAAFIELDSSASVDDLGLSRLAGDRY